MRSSSRPFLGLAILALALAGCGGNSGSQPTSVVRNLTVSTATVYSTSAASVGTVDDSDSRAVQSIIPLAVLSTNDNQIAVLWGTRDANGVVTSVREIAYKDDDATLYARYAANGGLLSVTAAGSDSNADLQKQTGSYVTFSQLEASGNSLIGSGVAFKNGTQDDSAKIRATLLDSGGVRVKELKDGGTESQLVTSLYSLASRDVIPVNDPLNGLSTVYQDSEARTKIISAVTKAAGLVVEKPFDRYISRVSGFLFLDQVAKSYTSYTAKGFSPTAAGDETTPLPYRDDLP